MDPINPDKTVSEIETDDVTISAPDSPPASGANNDGNLQGQQQQPQPQQAQGPPPPLVDGSEGSRRAADAERDGVRTGRERGRGLAGGWAA